MAAAETGLVVRDSLTGAPLVYTNERGGRFVYVPATFIVQVDRAGLSRVYGAARRVRLLAPPGWTVIKQGDRAPDPAALLCWHVRPVGDPPSCLVNLRLLIERPDGGISEVVHAVPVELRGRTQFEPSRHVLPFANSAADLGEVRPSADVFAETYQRTPFASAFFQGLYSRVVFLTGEPGLSHRGGLCTGMARTALEISLQQPESAAGWAGSPALRRAVQVWHGKQLADRALLASTVAWLTQGSRDAYFAFRRSVLGRGMSDVAMDVNVPRPWRRDLIAALIGSGHTVVPYAFRQTSDDRAEVWVYDPNHPRPEEWSESVIHFDLANDTYRYRHYDGSRRGQPSKVLAVRQAHYRAADTGWLGVLLSLTLFRPAARRPAWRSLLPAAAPLAGLLALAWWATSAAAGRSRRSAACRVATSGRVR